MNLVELAQRLKRLRTERGLTLEDVASRAGLTRGWLSKVENFRVTPSLPALSGIAQALGVTLSELFDGLDARPPIVVVRRSGRLRVARDEEIASALAYDALAHPRPNRRMDPFVITAPPTPVGGERAPLAHAGEEFLLVLSGVIRLDYGDAVHTLETGDAAYFDGLTPHRIVCLGDEPAQVLCVYHGAGDVTAGANAGESGDATE